MAYMSKDSTHCVAAFPSAFEVHRFMNRKVWFSAIYVDGDEIDSCLREDEMEMVSKYIESRMDVKIV